MIYCNEQLPYGKIRSATTSYFKDGIHFVGLVGGFMVLNKIEKKFIVGVLDLAYFIACFDGDYTAEKNKAINMLKMEMDISYGLENMNVPYEPHNTELNDILASLESLRDSDKEKVMFEMTSLASPTGKLSEKNEAILKQIAQVWGLEEFFKKQKRKGEEAAEIWDSIKDIEF